MKYFLILSFIILQSSAFECPSNEWFRFRNKCFLSEDSKDYSFQENVDFCESQNATSVSIHSEEENDFIKSKLKTAHSYWLGSRLVYFGRFTNLWLDGSFYNYSNWKERYGQINCPSAFFHLGEWLDFENCHYKHSAFCQIDFGSPFNKIQSTVNQLSKDLKQIKAKKESSARYWIFGILVLFIFCALILSMYKIVERIRWLTNEIKSSNVSMLQREPLTDNLDLKDED